MAMLRCYTQPLPEYGHIHAQAEEAEYAEQQKFLEGLARKLPLQEESAAELEPSGEYDKEADAETKPNTRNDDRTQKNMERVEL